MARPWTLAARCCLRGLLWASAVGAILVGAGAMAGLPTAVGIGLIVTLTLAFFALHSAWRLARGLVAFAELVPGQADVRARASGLARFSWPSLTLAVEGQAGVLSEPRLEGEAGGQPFEGSVDEGSELAEQALASLGIEVASEAGEAG